MVTKSIGKVFYQLFFSLLIVLATSAANAAIVLTLDRHQITIDDTFTMTIRVTAGEDLDSIDLDPLASNFDIIGRSQNSRHIFGSGGNESWSELALSLAPKHTGTLYIPALTLDGQKTQPTEIIVRESSPLPAGSLESVFLEVETNKDTIYVQEQLIFTVRIYQSINLDSPSISELKLDDSFVEQISQSSGQRRLNNTPYLVHEIKYAIFPQKSGQLTIPSLTFSGTELNRRRSLFDMGGQGKLYRKQSKAKTIEVMPVPSNIDSKNWLPAEQFSIEESWSTPPEDLAIGESTTRTLSIKAKGLLSEQLPPLLPPNVDGIKFYPDQPNLENQQNELGITSLRIDSSAMVITKAGDFTIPAIKVSWWDTSQNTLRWVSTKPRYFKINPAINAEILNDTPLSIRPSQLVPVTNDLQANDITSIDEYPQQLRLWQMLTAITSLAWLLTLFLFMRTKKQSRPGLKDQKNVGTETERKLYQILVTSCKNNNPKEQRAAIIDWAKNYWQNPSLTTLAEVAAQIDNNDIKDLLSDLDASLYSTIKHNWSSEKFITLLNQHKKQMRTQGKTQASKLQMLYTSPGQVNG